MNTFSLALNQFGTKLRLIFLPYLALSIIFITIYTFLHWLLIIKLELFLADDVYVNFLIPCALVWVPIFFWLRPRIKLLNLESKRNKDLLSVYVSIAGLSIALTAVISQVYMVAATGDLTKKDYISNIARLPLTKYYKIAHLHVNANRAIIQPYFEVSGKYNDQFNISLYFTSPIEDTLAAAKQSYRYINIQDPSKAPLIIFDNHFITPSELKMLDADRIAEERLSPEQAVKLYGPRGSLGALIIKPKKPFNYTDLNVTTRTERSPAPVAFAGSLYKKTIDNKLSETEEEAKFQAFFKESQAAYHNEKLAPTYLSRVTSKTDYTQFKKAVQQRYKDVKKPLILLLEFEPFESRLGKKLEWAFGSFAVGATIFLIALQFSSLRRIQSSTVKSNIRDFYGLSTLRELCVPRDGFFITPIIINVNILVFLAMVIAGLGFMSFAAPDLLAWGGNLRPKVLGGEYWRLLTNIFIHGGLVHLIMNVYGLLFISIFLEPMLGKVKFSIIYLASGILASLVSIWWHSATISVGASGAIFGLYGSFLALLTTNIFPSDSKKKFLIGTSIFVIYNLLVGLTGGIDNAAHLGGLGSGMVLGYMVYPGLQKDKLMRKPKIKKKIKSVSENEKTTIV